MGGDNYQSGTGEIVAFFVVWIAVAVIALGFVALVIATIAHS